MTYVSRLHEERLGYLASLRACAAHFEVGGVRAQHSFSTHSRGAVWVSPPLRAFTAFSSCAVREHKEIPRPPLPSSHPFAFIFRKV